MVPEATLRLTSVLKALEDVIGPAISEDSALAQEQLVLAKRSIALVIDQIPLEPAYMVTDAQDDRDLARKLAAQLEPGHPIADELAQAIAASEHALPASPPDMQQIRQGWLDLKATLETVVTRLSEERNLAGRDTLIDVMLAYSEKRTIRERAWVAATGFDPAPDTLPALIAAAKGIAAAS